MRCTPSNKTPALCGRSADTSALANALMTLTLEHQLVPAGVHHTNTETDDHLL
jgi:hypothetical protein